MCLVVLGGRSCTGGQHVLLIAANRDEMHDRPSLPLAWWPDVPEIAGGRDALAGGTWLAVRRDGRWATVLNDPLVDAPGSGRSRGTLVTEFLQAGDMESVANEMHTGAAEYGGFHFLGGQGERFCQFGSRTGGVEWASVDVHVCDNHGPGNGGPRARCAIQGFRAAAMATDVVGTLFALLADDRSPGEGKGDARPVFIHGDRFGTRCSTVLEVQTSGRIRLHERRFAPGGRGIGERTLSWCPE